MTAGGTSFETVFEQELAKYSPLRQEIQANLQRQTSLIGEISVRRPPAPLELCATTHSGSRMRACVGSRE